MNFNVIRKVVITVLITNIFLIGFLLFPKLSFAASTFITPAEGSITSNFGPRSGGYHFGIDIAKSGTVPIKASAAGVVRVSTLGYPGNFGGYGNVVVIKHNISINKSNTSETLYAHMISRSVAVGTTVKQGQIIGYMGNTGDSEGKHLHFEIHDGAWNGSKSNAVNPLNYLNKDLNPANPANNPTNGTNGYIKLDYDKNYGINTYNAPNGSYKGKTAGGTVYQVYNYKDGYYDIGANTWVPATSGTYKPYTLAINVSTNTYSSPNGAYKGKVTKGSTFKVYAYSDGFYDIGASTWVRNSYVIVTRPSF